MATETFQTATTQIERLELLARDAWAKVREYEDAGHIVSAVTEREAARYFDAESARLRGNA